MTWPPYRPAPLVLTPMRAKPVDAFQAKVEEVYTRCHPLRLAWYSVDYWFTELLQYEPSLDKYDQCFGLVAMMRVTTAWKGIAGERVRVIGGLGRGDCGFVFRRDVEYLVYGRASESGDLVASICSRTRPVSDAEEDLAILAEWQDRTVTP